MRVISIRNLNDNNKRELVIKLFELLYREKNDGHNLRGNFRLDTVSLRYFFYVEICLKFSLQILTK